MYYIVRIFYNRTIYRRYFYGSSGRNQNSSKTVNTIVDDSGTNSPKRQKPNVQEGVQERMLNRLSDFYSPTDWECFNAFNKLKSIIIR